MSIKLRLLLVLGIISLGVQAQKWYPDNATWIFNKQELLSYQAHGYIEYEVVKDTIIESLEARLVLIDSKHYNGIETGTDSIIVRESNSRIYYWDEDQFKLMYDFNLNKGDTLDVEIAINNCDSVSPIIIDSVFYKNISGHELKVQIISYTLFAENSLGITTEVTEQIIENIGSERQFIYSPGCLIDEEFTYSGLRCYNDENIFYKNDWWSKHYPDIGCDSLINDSTSNIQVYGKSLVQIYPNPSDNFVIIENTFNNIIIKNSYAELYSSTGIKLDRIPIGKATRVNLNQYQPGLLLIKIVQDNAVVEVFKILKR
jgi:hypothetical protein